MEAPKSRGEWVRAMDEIIWQYEHGGFGNWMKSRDAAIDSIMALQSEVERVRLRENELVCAVDLGIQQLQQIQHTEGMLQEDVEIIEKMKKARQPK